MLTNGVETSRAEDSVLRVCASRGYRHINVFTTPTCIIIADDKFDGLSFMRTIKRRGIDLNKIEDKYEYKFRRVDNETSDMIAGEFSVPVDSNGNIIGEDNGMNLYSSENNNETSGIRITIK